MPNSLINEIMGFRRGYDIRQLWKTIGSHSSDLMAHNLIVGIPDLGDTILYQQIIAKKFQPFVRQTELISYPPKGTTHLRKAIITGIAIVDIKHDGQGGEAIIESGGVGAGFVDIKLNSELFRGFSFIIIIIGKYFDQLLDVNQNIQQN